MELLKPLLTLLAVLNPVGVIPFFIHFTANLTPAQRQRTIWVSTLTVFLVIAASALGGLQLLRFFGISIALRPEAFQEMKPGTVQPLLQLRRPLLIVRP